MSAVPYGPRRLSIREVTRRFFVLGLFLCQKSCQGNDVCFDLLLAGASVAIGTIRAVSRRHSVRLCEHGVGLQRQVSARRNSNVI